MRPGHIGAGVPLAASFRSSCLATLGHNRRPVPEVTGFLVFKGDDFLKLVQAFLHCKRMEIERLRGKKTGVNVAVQRGLIA
jgi:hypothetical protein